MKIHIARAGETLWDIAQKYNIPLKRLQELNSDLGESDQLKRGEKVRVPTGKIPLTVSKHDTRERVGDSETEKRKQEGYKEYPHTSEESSEKHEFLTEELPKPPTIDELTKWSQTMMDDSSSMVYDSSVYENHANPSYMDAPIPYPYYWQGLASMPSVPVPQDPFFLSSRWPLQPFYPPPVPMNHPNEYSNHLAMEYREWKESSSSEG